MSSSQCWIGAVSQSVWAVQWSAVAAERSGPGQARPSRGTKSGLVAGLAGQLRQTGLVGRSLARLEVVVRWCGVLASSLQKTTPAAQSSHDFLEIPQ